LVDKLYSERDATRLADTFPADHFKTVDGYDGEKGYSYDTRCLIGMGADGVSYSEQLSPHWRQLGLDLLPPVAAQADGYVLSSAFGQHNVASWRPARLA